MISEMHLTGIAGPPVHVDQLSIRCPSTCRLVTHALHAPPYMGQVLQNVRFYRLTTLFIQKK